MNSVYYIYKKTYGASQLIYALDVKGFYNQRSTLEDIPKGMDFISERRQRNSPKTQVIVAQENWRTHQDAEEGQAAL